MNVYPLPPAANFHLWQPCNMKCLFCFARFLDVREGLPKGHLPRDRAIQLTELLSGRLAKLTFAGGEPTLCPWLGELIRAAQRRGCTTMVVTNGTGILRVLDEHGDALDWVALSIDSADPTTLRATGRAVRGRRALTPNEYLSYAAACRAKGVGLKINTVVSAANVDEDLTSFVRRLNPERWKLFQVLPVEGQNDGDVDDLLISSEAFDRFVERHRSALGDLVVPESNDDMRGSYAMVDPAGRFFDNTAGRHTYSRPILEDGLDAAWSDITFRPEVFEERGGSWDWERVA